MVPWILIHVFSVPFYLCADSARCLWGAFPRPARQTCEAGYQLFSLKHAEKYLSVHSGRKILGKMPRESELGNIGFCLDNEQHPLLRFY